LATMKEKYLGEVRTSKDTSKQQDKKTKKASDKQLVSPLNNR
jgi:hypothetical protein